jgi:peptidoglycan/xylan/chitin deacetylase (PgdA/CDA1 family)
VAGKRAAKTTVVQAGQSVEIAAANDHVEDTTSTTQKVNGAMPPNPQYDLATAPGELIIERGKESNKIASVTFHATGKANVTKQVALTFDDGPNPPYTNKILKILHQHNVPATFFLIGYEAQKYPSLVRQEEKAGMTIGDHSWSHPLGFASLDQGELQNQIGRTYDELKSLGVTPYLFRPPGGSFDGDVVETARRLGLRTVIWTADTHDYVAGRTSKDITKYVMNTVHPGAIVLMHDGGGDRSATVKALPDIIKGLRKKGYTLTAIPKDGWEPGPGATPTSARPNSTPTPTPEPKPNSKQGGA